MQSLDDYNFDLPEELIAQYPAGERSASRLFVLDRHSGESRHNTFTDLPGLLRAGDVLVFNSSRVVPARLFMHRASGGRVECVLVRQLDSEHWLIITNRSKRLGPAEKLFSEADPSLSLEILGREGEHFKVRFNQTLTEDVLRKAGKIPLPPYIRREADETDRERYQTVYAATGLSVAAPTAGLHFTPELLEQLDDMGVERCEVRLDVSWGTFAPVREHDLDKHQMHSERYFVSDHVSARLRQARAEGRRIIAVGTTSLRVLETIYNDGAYTAGDGETSIFIRPPYQIQSIDCLLTNFHTPGSTL